ncbi:DNA repair protein RecN [Marnyiella aurantia]|uniref:DNA repair protein RecN n=1 Tax=Marnyiella aurantia TaxID=2758037 RepID=A0A7D7LS83_9FLAO|nr:DNA repair protein RecN [Marnyiella aurantia]MBA5247221.1 DNA repair protein RecN [Marnyiella aurantia]QMS97453.1 DNA repair protein RecN [Marnyiella aurantia]
MLNRIFIKNFALIDSLELQINKGLQVITGETGAGKSIILGALRLIMGERADVKAMQDSATKSVVEAEFLLDESYTQFFLDNDLDFETHTLVRRELLPTGKSRAFINDVPVTLEVLKSLSGKLIDIHSQFETSNLFDEDYQFSIVDGLSENKSLIVDYKAAFEAFNHLKSKLHGYKLQLSEGNKEADYKQFLLTELSEASLDEVDWEDLLNQLKKQENADAITENLKDIFVKLDAEQIGLLDTINDVKSKLNRIADLSHEFTLLNTRLAENIVEFKDIVFDLQNEAEKIETDPEVLERLNEKVNRINSLFLKHQVATVAELIEVRDALAGEQSGMDELQQLIQDTEAEISEQEKNLTRLAKLLASNRKKAVPVFKNKIETLLKQLGLEKAKIEVELTARPDFSRFGKENISLLFQANTGFPLKPIETAISGGERSRVMLSVKKLMAENAELPTLILDELDTGVSGKIAEEMGNVMREMSRNMQLIVITHLAQVAAKGDDHFKVQKEEVSGRTQSTIRPLDADEKLQEIAQLLSGAKVTQAAIEQARLLMN